MAEQSTHGLVQSEALTLAAQKLSKAKLYQSRTRELYPEDQDTMDLGEHRVYMAQCAYDAAYKAYTNPFNVQKTVDARWPNVPE